MITRYDGTRFITEEEIDKEFLDHWVLIAIENDQQGLSGEGYLLASADSKEGNYALLCNIEETELEEEQMSTIVYGCRERGGDLRVYILD